MKSYIYLVFQIPKSGEIITANVISRDWSSLVQADDLMKSMLEQYGPLIGGQELWRAMGYRTWAAFGRAVRNGTLGVKIFTVPGRKGKFALTADVAAWLAKLKE